MDIPPPMGNNRTMGNTLLSVADLTCARGGLPVLSGVSFDVSAGEALVLTGRNGSGKTTLLRTIAGLQPADKGEISCDPESIAYAAHADGIKATLTVAENLQFWASVFGRGNIEEALGAFDLGGLRNRLAQTLSAGQKRRLGLSRLVLTGRRLWILDEPTVSLDQASVGLFSKSVETHLASGGAALIASHIDLGLEARALDLTRFRNQGAKVEEPWI